MRNPPYIKHLLLWVVIILTCLKTFASHSRGSSTKPWRMSPAAYVEKYGGDSISNLLIEFWFHRRKKTNKAILISGSASSILGAAAAPILFKQPIHPGFKKGSGSLLFLAMMIPPAIVLTAAMFRRAKYSKKKLWLLLESGKTPGKKLQEKVNAFAKAKALQKNVNKNRRVTNY